MAAWDRFWITLSVTTNPTNNSTGANGPLRPGALKLPEACQYLGGISEITLRRLIGRGLIKPNRALRHIIIPVTELDRFLTEGGE